MDFKLSPYTELQTDRLRMRQITLDDAADLFLMRSDKQVMQYICRPLFQTIDDATALINNLNELFNNNNGIHWVLTLKNENKLIGNIGIWNFDKPNFRAEIGYVMLTEYHGKGLMNEALQAAVDYGFNTLHLHSIIAKVNPENNKSIQLLQRNKFNRNAYFKEDIFWEGKFCDTVVYTRLNKN